MWAVAFLFFIVIAGNDRLKGGVEQCDGSAEYLPAGTLRLPGIMCDRLRCHHSTFGSSMLVNTEIVSHRTHVACRFALVGALALAHLAPRRTRGGDWPPIRATCSPQHLSARAGMSRRDDWPGSTALVPRQAIMFEALS